MMKTPVATIALVAVALQTVAAIDFYPPIDAIPTTAATECAEFDLKQVTRDSQNFASYLEAKDEESTPPEDLAKCATAAGLQKSRELRACITTSVIAPPVFNPKGGSALCPLSKGDSCTTDKICKDSKCAFNGARGAAADFVCIEVGDAWSVVIESQTDPVYPIKTLGPVATFDKAWTAALATVPECSVAGAVTPSSGYVSNKDLKEWTSLYLVTKSCSDKRNAVETSVKTELKKESNNKITLQSIKQSHSFEELTKCVDEDTFNYQCGPSRGCSAILCNPGALCSENKDCGTKSCKKSVSPSSNTISTLGDFKVCSGSSITSTILAVGGAVLTAVALF